MGEEKNIKLNLFISPNQKK